MGTFTKVKSTAFDELQVDAGLLLNSFTPATPSVTDANIIAATTGGIHITCTPTTSDWGSDIDNCPDNTKELLHIDSWTCQVSTTLLGVTEETVKLALGAWTTGAGSSVRPSKDVQASMFKTLWWVGDLADGGYIAINLASALSTGGFDLQTTKNGKGSLSITLTCFVSIDDPDVFPMDFYVSDAA